MRSIARRRPVDSGHCEVPVCSLEHRVMSVQARVELAHRVLVPAHESRRGGVHGAQQPQWLHLPPARRPLARLVARRDAV